jgi:hypothetical protein
MGSDISLWIERRLPSGEWEAVARQKERQPHWYFADENDGDDKEMAKKMLAALRERSIPVSAQFADVMERAADLGFPESQYEWALERNYNLFAIIADHRNTRNGYEFTSHVISPPRGFPPDLSDTVLEDAARAFFDASAQPTREQRINALFADKIVAPSWVTLEELLAVNWDAAAHSEGVGDFLDVLREEIVPIGPPDSVRLVFFFDC